MSQGWSERLGKFDALMATFEEAMQLHKEEYDRLLMQVLTYESMDAFRNDYLGLNNMQLLNNWKVIK